MTHSYYSRGLVLFVMIGLVSAPAVQGQGKDNQKSNPKTLAAFREVVAKPGNCTVRVQCEGKDAALGTIVGADGWILTKYSELKDGRITCWLKDGRPFEAKIVGVQEKFDIAMLKIEAKDLTAIELCNSKCAPVGNWVASAGLTDDPVAIGVVSVASRNVPTKGNLPAPLPNSGYLGVSLDLNASTAKISQVMPGTAAEKAGIKVNDVVLAVNGKHVEDGEALITMLGAQKAGATVKLKIKRGEEDVEMKVELGKRPAGAGRSDVQNSMGSELSNRRTGFPTILQHDSIIKPTDCGGPLCDLDGKCIGINIARAGRTESYAVPSEAIVPLLADLKSGKLMPKVETVSAEKLGELKSALQKAEAEKTAAEKKLADVKAEIQKAEVEKTAAEKKLADARAALQKAEAEKDKEAKKDK